MKTKRIIFLLFALLLCTEIWARTTHTSTGAAGIINAHPNLEGEWNWTTELRKGYDINNLDEALAILEKVEGTSNYLKYCQNTIRYFF